MIAQNQHGSHVQLRPRSRVRWNYSAVACDRVLHKQLANARNRRSSASKRASTTDDTFRPLSVSVHMAPSNDPFEFDGGSVSPGERDHTLFEISETYLSEPIRIPVTIINGKEAGPTVFLTAATHGDELNGVEVVRHVADEFDHSALQGTLVCIPVVNVPGFNALERYLPLDNSDLNRSFPGSRRGQAAHRMARSIYCNFIEPCDFGIDFHTSTRGRTNLVHVRTETERDEVNRLARAFGSNIILSEAGPEGSLRRVATHDGTPTIVVELGEARRFQRELIDEAVDGVRSVFAEFGLFPQQQVRWPGWRSIVIGGDTHWVRADNGGIVEMFVEGGEFVDRAEPLCTITNPFDTVLTTVQAPFAGLVIGILETPVVYPGNPLCRLARISDETERVLRDETVERG